MKVVINRKHGGFGVSLEAARFMAARGNETARADVADYETHGVFYADKGYARTDPDLIAAVQALGDRANTDCSRLAVVEIPDDVEWVIQEFDGREWVAEKHRTWE